MHNDRIQFKFRGVSFNSFGSTIVRGHENVSFFGEEGSNSVDNDIDGIEVIDGNVEEPLDLGGMKVHSHQTGRPHHLEHVGNHFGRDGYTGSILFVLAGKRITGYDNCD